MESMCSMDEYFSSGEFKKWTKNQDFNLVKWVCGKIMKKLIIFAVYLHWKNICLAFLHFSYVMGFQDNNGSVMLMPECTRVFECDDSAIWGQQWWSSFRLNERDFSVNCHLGSNHCWNGVKTKNVFVCLCVWLGLFSLQFWSVIGISLFNVMCGNRSQPLALWEVQTIARRRVPTLEHWTLDSSSFPPRTAAVNLKLLIQTDFMRVRGKRNNGHLKVIQVSLKTQLVIWTNLKKIMNNNKFQRKIF